MGKRAKTFTFQYPLRHKVVRDLKIVTQHVGDLLVEGTGYIDPSVSTLDLFDRYSVDIDFVRWQGTDIKAVLEVTGGMDELIEACIRHFAREYDHVLQHAA